MDITFLKAGVRHSGQLLNEIFVYSKDITPSSGYLKAWGISQMTIVALRPRNVAKNSYSRHLRIVRAVVSQVRVTETYFSSNGASHD